MKRITFNPTSANPGETLYVSVPKLAVNEVIVPGSLALVFDINLKVTGAQADNYLVQNVSRALVDKFHVKFAATTVQETAGYDIYKIFEDLFLSKEERENMLREGIQDTALNKLRSDAGNKDTSNAGRKHTECSIWPQVPHQPGPPHSYRPRSVLPAGPLQRLGLRTNPGTSKPSGKRL